MLVITFTLILLFSLGVNAFTFNKYRSSLAHRIDVIHLQKSRASIRATPFISYGSQKNTQFRTECNYRNKLHMASIDIVFLTYSDALQQYPLIIKGSTGFVLCGIGDTIAQTRSKIQMNDLSNYVSNSMNQVDYQRLVRFATKGFFGALIWGTWYDISAEIVSSENVALVLSSLGVVDGQADNNIIVNIARTFSSIVIEQLIACPIVFTFWDIPVATILNRASLRRIPYEVEDKLGNMLIANAKVWTVANLIIYNVPLQYRVGLANLIDIFWQSIVSDFAADCGREDDECTIDDNRFVPLRPDDKISSQD